MGPVEWVKAHKEDFLDLQQSGISALGAAAQMVHEAFNADGTMSGLAKKNNFMGLKWPLSGWVREFGGYPVDMRTWEVLNGARQDLTAAFTAFPDWNSCKEAYRSLITGSHYGGALQYVNSPLGYIQHLYSKGYATDPLYVKSVMRWIEVLRPIFDEPPVTRVTWGENERDYMLEKGFITSAPADMDAPVTFRWVLTVFARIVSRLIFKDGRF